MTWKPIILSEHAKLRIRQREIRRSEIKWLLARGAREQLEGEGSNTRWSCTGYLGRKEAVVIFVEGRTQIDVVTVTWVKA